MLEGRYSNQFVGSTTVELQNGILKFSGIKNWDPKKRFGIDIAIIVFYYYVIAPLVYKLPEALFYVETLILGVSAMALLALIARNQIEIWFHKNERDRISVEVPLHDLSRVELSERKTTMTISSKNNKLLKSGEFTVERVNAGSLEEMYHQIKLQLSPTTK